MCAPKLKTLHRCLPIFHNTCGNNCVGTPQSNTFMDLCLISGVNLVVLIIQQKEK